jgi:hypothetical protein
MTPDPHSRPAGRDEHERRELQLDLEAYRDAKAEDDGERIPLKDLRSMTRIDKP